jgi:hypothetical protein
LFLTGHVFGQLPSLTATLLALCGTVLADYLQNGGALTAVTAALIFSAGMSAHHATLLFWPFLISALGIRTFSKHQTSWQIILFRLAVFISGAILAGYLAVFPFWQWGAHQTLQTPIDHASRHNFLQDPLAIVLFFLPVYGLLILLIPSALKIGVRKQYLGIGLAFLVLFVLGLGDTSPLPRLIFGQVGIADIDRFGLLVLLGIACNPQKVTSFDQVPGETAVSGVRPSSMTYMPACRVDLRITTQPARLTYGLSSIFVGDRSHGAMSPLAGDQSPIYRF